MKKMISKFADSLLSREDLKRVKGGYGAGCGYCITNNGQVKACGNNNMSYECICPSFNANNACG